MKTTKITQLIITGMLAVALVVAAIAYSLAWYQMDVATPYTFEIHANGVLYVYVDSVVVDNDSALVPAVCIPGAISEGLNYDVLTLYNAGDANPSYISKVASVTPIKGQFRVNNEGYAYDKVELPKDEDGYTLYPQLTREGLIVWINDSDHSQGWRTTLKVTEWDDETPIAWSRETDYEPQLDSNDHIIWNEAGQALLAEWAWLPEDEQIQTTSLASQRNWECREVVREGSSECTVNVNIRFKASDDPEVNDFYDNASFAVRRLYITRQDETIAEGVGMGAAYGNSGVQLASLSADKLTCSYTMYGSEEFFMHAEVYLTQPDELLDPQLRGQEVYLAVYVSVEITQFGS